MTIFTGQTHSELMDMEEQIRGSLESGDLPDPEFHSAVLRRMVLHKARARLRELHASLRARSLVHEDRRADVPKAMGWGEEVGCPGRHRDKRTGSRENGVGGGGGVAHSLTRNQCRTRIHIARGGGGSRCSRFEKISVSCHRLDSSCRPARGCALAGGIGLPQ